MYDYLYAKIENVDLYSHINRLVSVYPMLGNGHEITQLPSIEAAILYKVPNPDNSHTTVVLKVYDHYAMDFPVNTPDGGIIFGKLYMPCGFAFAFYDAYNPTVEDFKAVDWYTADVVCYDDLDFFPSRN